MLLWLENAVIFSQVMLQHYWYLKFSLAATIDFTIMALDDTGDWKTGIGCTETNGTGPCADQTISETPGLHHLCLFLLNPLSKDFKTRLFSI